MKTKEIVKTIESITGLYLEISINDNQTEIASTYNPEKLNYQYFNVYNELESYFTEIYIEGNSLLLDRILKLLYSGFEFWNSLKEKSFSIDFNFDNKELEHLTTTLTAEQLLHIAEIKIHYIQSLISKIEKLTTTPKTKSVFKLSKKQGVRTDLIRILNALYELRLFYKTDGQIPSKEMFMKQVGEFFGIDLSKYDTDLSQALNNTSLEANLKVFQQMKEVTQNSHHIGKKEK